MNEYAEAISFANCYFALVDGLASGLDSHLAENVVLDWFGRTVTGRRNVTAFMEAHKVNSRHMFRTIMPCTSIGYQRKPSNRKRVCSYRNDKESFNTDNEDGRLEGQTVFQETCMSAADDVITDINQNEIDPKKITAMDIDKMSYCLDEGDLSNLFKLEISSTNIEEIEQSINRIKLEEEMAPTVKAIKRERGQGDGPVVVETSSVKYVEADGEIEFSRRVWKQGAWNAYISARSNVHTWRRSCKLQIAYSTLTDQPTLEPSRKSRNSATLYDQPKARLFSLGEINEITNRLVPNTNDFGGFLKDVDFFEDRKDFLASLGTEIAIKDPLNPVLKPHYVRNKLVFDKPCVNHDDQNDRNKKKFVFNYQIHLIIYEGTNKCKVNLLPDFEETKMSKETKIEEAN
ncbi:PREDICTED: uncharacterized protein LOC107187888 [Dufourea novaeangliae]|uniref:uncharacterized protein LOC107187888 n=1 Tax=Dufourea novaeangliae TaxID=178035 RepID=UPI0007675AA7|nr:PREDICTED: uncharacterized protein LOC107187888 [Dufourea novaeangliae]XP_015431572.1 PREDICTED: uncharacterized protein LOC107187888 [Dufourea novaeangliae]XP_015431582.1 PREDICTED: uncharacterized protein LOC107187888 [Dufourea novaeangliae]